MTLSHWLDTLGDGRESALWIAVSIGVYVLVAHGAWRLHFQNRRSSLGWFDRWRFRSLAWQIVRLLYYVVVPYGLTVNRQLISGRSLGLVGSGSGGFVGWTADEWLQGVAWTLVAVLVGVTALGGSWSALARRLGSGEVFSLHHRPPAWEALWDAIFVQVHWCFYRAAAGLWLCTGHSTVSVLAGLGLAALEMTGDPGLHFDLRWPSAASGWVRLATVGWLTAILLLLTENLWLTILAHWGTVCVVNAWAGKTSHWSLTREQLRAGRSSTT